MNEEIDRLYSKKSTPLFEEVLKSKTLRERSKVVRVFNPDVKILEDYPFNVTVLADQYFLAVNEKMEVVTL